MSPPQEITRRGAGLLVCLPTVIVVIVVVTVAVIVVIVIVVIVGREVSAVTIVVRRQLCAN